MSKTGSSYSEVVPTTADAGPEPEAAMQLEQDLYDLIRDGLIADLTTRRKPHRIMNAITCPNSEIKNKHPRDTRIRFETEGHTYFLKIDSEHEIPFPMSVSNVWARYFEQFDADTVIQKYYDRWCDDPSNRYYESIREMRRDGIPDHKIQARIKKDWADASVIASAQGVNMHRQIELALGGLEFDVSSLEIQHFIHLVHNVLVPKGYRVYRTEWAIYDEKVMIAGQIDALFVDTYGHYHMVDWKRCKHPLDPMANAQYNRYGAPPCEHLLDNDYVHYSLQQNIYAAILHRRYQLDVSSMALAQLHPDHESFRLITVPMWSSLADSLLEQSGMVAGGLHKQAVR